MIHLSIAEENLDCYKQLPVPCFGFIFPCDLAMGFRDIEGLVSNRALIIDTHSWFVKPILIYNGVLN